MGPGLRVRAGEPILIPALSQRYGVFALDLMGAGFSDKPRIEYSFQMQVNHVAGFIDTFGLGPVRVVGNSQGAYVAIKYVMDHPARAEAAVLISIGRLSKAMGLSDDGKAAPLPRFDGSKESLRKFMQLIVNDPSKLTEELIDHRFTAASMPGHKEMMESLDAYRQLMREDSNQRQMYDVKARLPMLTIPWSMIWGEADRTAPLDPLGNRMHALFPNIPFHVVEGSGHQVQNDKPEECNRLVSEFFAVH